MRPELDQPWVGDWVAEKLVGHPVVAGVTVTGSQTIEVERKQGLPPVGVYLTSVGSISGNDVRAVLEVHPEVQVVANVKRGGHIQGDAMKAAERHRLGVFGYSDLMRAIRDADPAAFVSPETEFVLRGFRQHGQVDAIERLDEARYRLRRQDLGDVTVLVSNEYEMTASKVRELIDDFDDFDAIGASNPNGRISGDAREVASSARVKLFTWRELFGALNKRW